MYQRIPTRPAVRSTLGDLLSHFILFKHQCCRSSRQKHNKHVRPLGRHDEKCQLVSPFRFFLRVSEERGVKTGSNMVGILVIFFSREHVLGGFRILPERPLSSFFLSLSDL